MQEKDEQIVSVNTETMALVNKNLGCTLELKNIKTKLQQCEADCDAKVNTLQKRLAQEKKGKEKSCTTKERPWRRGWLKTGCYRRIEQGMQRLTMETTSFKK